VWFTDEAIQAWGAEPRTTPRGQPHYSALAITTALTMGMVFHLALRQTEELIGSIIGLLGLDLAVPDVQHIPLRFCFGMWRRRSAMALNGMVGSRIRKRKAFCPNRTTPPAGDPCNSASGGGFMPPVSDFAAAAARQGYRDNAVSNAW
jgi:hypothetical protein